MKKLIGYGKKMIALIAIIFAFMSIATAQSFRVGVAGLNHDHIYNVLNDYKKGRVNIVGIAEPNKHLWEKFGKQFNIPDSLFFTDLKTMLAKKKPQIVLGYNAVGNHVDVVEACAPLGIPVMVEKPLAATLVQAKRIEELANKYHITVLTNYETTWYPSFQGVYDIVNKDSIGAIRKMVAHDGHQGPREIGCSEEFLAWLTDPVLNGAGALNDFGCYGADLMTWLMHGQRPIAVTAVGRHYKPDVYPKVEDDATITVEYPTATGLIEGSWNWPFSIKDLEVFGQTGYLHATDMKNLNMRMRENKKSIIDLKPLSGPNDDPVNYFNAFLKKEIKGEDDRTSLKYNMIVMEILDAAKRSIKEGKRIVL
ncbi:Gfo/Idh/MocA family oxidoreductase [Mucilaginibacter sp. BJC16-A38]|uniref:Gfo/Idh/MocA family protein n=1 Tax=Mucilaginibacter phenanthrenivorans TaxID=1234842 RepID=UPI0021583D09|nr:Gfo/Idh/MocA family oxidoreductase [Mucilaginibacter phenanthrenivorans]MCR8556461.1 Gfo/Idh/MocA family oxidoreductase [Mucilaginibacter phenanthrenivorans]